MKGLILKDICNQLGQLKAFAMMLVIFIVCFANSAEGTLIIMCAVYATVMVINNLAMDESCQWEIFALTMPVTRRQLVLWQAEDQFPLVDECDIVGDLFQIRCDMGGQ